MTEKLTRILQVEDEEIVQKIVGRILALDDIEVEVAANLEQAMKALDGANGYSGISQYDALLLDMSFPGGNGAVVAKKARDLGYKGRIVMFSGKDMEEARKQTRDLDNVGYLSKPADMKKFVPALEGTYSD